MPRARLLQGDLGQDPCGETQKESEAGSSENRALSFQRSTVEHSQARRVSSSRVENSWSTGILNLMSEVRSQASGGEQSVMKSTCALR
jgi:hypothetical protein